MAFECPGPALRLPTCRAWPRRQGPPVTAGCVGSRVLRLPTERAGFADSAKALANSANASQVTSVPPSHTPDQTSRPRLLDETSSACRTTPSSTVGRMAGAMVPVAGDAPSSTARTLPWQPLVPTTLPATSPSSPNSTVPQRVVMRGGFECRLQIVRGETPAPPDGSQATEYQSTPYGLLVPTWVTDATAPTASTASMGSLHRVGGEAS